MSWHVALWFKYIKCSYETKVLASINSFIQFVRFSMGHRTYVSANAQVLPLSPHYNVSHEFTSCAGDEEKGL